MGEDIAAMLALSKRLSYYKREDVRQAIVDHSASKEIAVRFTDHFGKRPDVLRYPSDVLEFVKKGATSFHCSEELWNDPLAIVSGSSKEEVSENRRGWDLVLDIDCPILEFSALGAQFIIKALEHYGITRVDIKFSGNHGFHIGVPFASFPARVHDVEIKDWFPEGPRKIAGLLQRMIAPHLERSLLEKNTPEEIAILTKVPLDKVWNGKTLHIESFLKIDTVLIAPRHLYRMPYSLNEKSGLVSIPITVKDLESFDKSRAIPENVVVEGSFLRTLPNTLGEAKRLFIEALDEHVEEIMPEVYQQKKEGHITITEAINETLFPPCMKLTLLGLEDGRKRALFTLLNFLRSVGWSQESAKNLITEWNTKNKPPLSSTIIEGQITHSYSKKEALPPNCSNAGYYLSYGVCKPDTMCQNISNPANYSILKLRQQQREKREKEIDAKEREQQKEANKKERERNKERDESKNGEREKEPVSSLKK